MKAQLQIAELIYLKRKIFLFIEVSSSEIPNFENYYSFSFREVLKRPHSWIELMGLKHKRRVVVKSAKSKFYSSSILSPPSIWIYFSGNRRNVLHGITLNWERNKERRLYRTRCRLYNAIEWERKWERDITLLVLKIFLSFTSFIPTLFYVSTRTICKRWNYIH